MTKIICPTCGVQGHPQTRSNSLRVQHYLGYIEGKRRYKYHRIVEKCLNSLEVNGSKTMEVNNINWKSVSRNISGRSLAWLGHRPPTPTTRVRIPAAASSARFKLVV